MPGQIAIQSPAIANRRQPLLTSPDKSTPSPLKKKGRRRGSRMGEAAGDCAAVWCCCPCAMMHLIVLAVYRVPTGIWRKKKRNRLLKKKGKQSDAAEKERRRNNQPEEEETDGEEDGAVAESDVVGAWEKEMMDQFYGAGFWRSESRRTDSDS